MKPQDILAASKAFYQAYHRDVVDADVIAYRSRICRQCKIRDKSMVAGLLKTIIDGNGVPSEIADYRCGACKCPLVNLIPTKEPHQDSPKERARREKGNKHCWMLKL